MRNFTILVTGGAGFIGSHFVEYLLNRYDDIAVVNVDCLTYAGSFQNTESFCRNPRYRFVRGNICDADLIKHIFEEYQIDCVVNFAAESHVDRSIENPDLFVQTNVLGTLNLLSHAAQAWTNEDGTYRAGTVFLQISTDEVYGEARKREYPSEEAPLKPRNPYAASKASADLMVMAYVQTYGFPARITRSANNYGPRQFPEKFIPLATCNILQGKEVPIYGDGLQKRNWLHVTDNCKAIDLILQNGTDGEIYNIPGQTEKANLEVVDEIGQILSIHPQIKHVTDRKGHDRRYGMDGTKMKQSFDWKPEICFSEGLRQTVDWYVASFGSQKE